MKVLVTGSVGSIGTHIMTRLVEQGRGVRTLDDFSNRFSENLDRLEKALSIAQ